MLHNQEIKDTLLNIIAEMTAEKDKLGQHGMKVGISAGAAVWAAARIAEENPEKCVVTLLPDSADRYGSLGL